MNNKKGELSWVADVNIYRSIMMVTLLRTMLANYIVLQCVRKINKDNEGIGKNVKLNNQVSLII